MNNDQFDDLKQFIAASVSQSEERIRGDMDKLRLDMDKGFQSLREEMVNSFSGVGDAIEEIHTQLEQHERRLTKLEQQVL